VSLQPALLASKAMAPGPSFPFLAALCRSHVTYIPIYDAEAFSVGIFMLPAGSRIPLHDHPGMSVVSALLFGTLRLTSYDLLPHGDTGNCWMGLAASGLPPPAWPKP
jgi:quercetin dioxygenase-like cupin family protein